LFVEKIESEKGKSEKGKKFLPFNYNFFFYRARNFSNALLFHFLSALQKTDEVALRVNHAERADAVFAHQFFGFG
jgi:hypothetical protein